MYMLRKRILTDSDLEDATTWKQDLPNTGSITALELVINADRHANRAVATVEPSLASCISRLEIISESTKKVISVTGPQLAFLNYLDFGRAPARVHRELADAENRLHLFLLGGRSLYDTEYGFDMAKLKNAFLNYTYDLQEGVAEYFKADTHDINVYEWMWMGSDAPKFKGYFKTRQVLAYTTTGADVVKTLPITPGLPLRRVIVRNKETDTAFGGVISDIELEVNNGEYSPAHIVTPQDWLRAQPFDYGLANQDVHQTYIVAAATDQDVLADWSNYEAVVLQGGSPAAAAACAVPDLTATPPDIQASVTGEANIFTVGYGYQGCLLIGFDHFVNGEDLLHTAGMGALKLYLTEVAAGDDVAVVLQEVELY